MSKEKELNVSEALGFTDDLMFQNVMKDPVACRMLLQEVFPELDIQILNVSTQERIALNTNEKFSVLDVLVKDEQGRRYDMEMQVARKEDMDKRARYYLFKMMEDGFLRQGEEYENLTAAYVIFILPFDPKGKGLKRYSFVYTAREDPTVELNDGSEIIYLNTKGTKGKIRPGLNDLYRMIEGKPTSNGKFIKYIKKSMDSYRKTVEWRKHVMNTEEVAEAAKQLGMEKGLEEGRKKGMEEGRKEGLITGIFDLISVLKDYGETNQGILQHLKQKYGNTFSDDQLESFLKQS
ncbi:Rpn family recombination-promoting nuclease/putative transposase [Lactobacillus sp. UMNPBX12]|uniref:Rpn family recombination-promoting nuclease/putative transposase n=1 Tax=Lactobacillus sp. UMNPBX12 TaxID=2042035 RepID=UPI000BEEB6D8|nr:Rpn family recombination-promoting nuclease/putative transposase [Lactobacillus sp. UMNPBX12]PEG91217.1 hypothetical protein CP363_02695 [Lactobacillus sp. UMNPBX12]PEG93135.1 hypothetical protein CP362_02895 [Lactobacillus sp. UMNPBX11]